MFREILRENSVKIFDSWETIRVTILLVFLVEGGKLAPLGVFSLIFQSADPNV